jgi:Leucine-rich repeat (LRR) protein
MLADLIGKWEAGSAEEQVERQLLLKELRIGRRAEELAVWSVEVSVHEVGDKGGLSHVSMRLRLEGIKEVVANVSVVKADLSEHTTLREVPEELRRFKEHMRELKVRSRALKALLEWLGELRNLQKLDLSGCDGLTALPQSIGRLTGLQELNLSSCFELTALPEWLGELRNLQTLNLSLCDGLTALPESMSRLTGLEELKVEKIQEYV